MTEDNYIMWLNSFADIPTFARVKIYEHFKSAENVWNADKKDFMEIEGISSFAINKITENKNISSIEKTLNFINKKNTSYITVNSPLYPQNLKYISDYPLGFFMFGQMPDDKLKKAAIVGTRKATEYGKIQAKKFAYELAKNDVVIVSGMADGIDTCAHSGAIEAKGKTIAVIGCGIDITYPKHNRNLEIAISKNGCIITEYALGTRPYPRNFPIRNRIISGLCDALIVMEAPEKSGAVITANIAAEHGKTVFALPGNISKNTSAGTNKLIKDGALPLTSANDIFYELGINKKDESKKTKKHISQNNNLGEAENKILKYISDEPISIDEIAIKTNLPLPLVSSTLTILELESFVTKISANRYITRK